MLAALEDSRDSTAPLCAVHEVARNTATTWTLHDTTVRLDGLTDEAMRHDAFLDQALAASVGSPAPGGQG